MKILTATAIVAICTTVGIMYNEVEQLKEQADIQRQINDELINVINTNADVSRKVKSVVDTHTLAIEYLFTQHKNWGKASTNECPREDIIL